MLVEGESEIVPSGKGWNELTFFTAMAITGSGLTALSRRGSVAHVLLLGMSRSVTTGRNSMFWGWRCGILDLEAPLSSLSTLVIWLEGRRTLVKGGKQCHFMM